MRIKNKEIASKLGISATAVSLAINNRPGVSNETRQKVLKMVNDDTKQSMKNAGTEETISQSIILCVHKNHGLIMDDKPFFSEIVEAIQLEAMKRNFTLTLVHHMPGQDNKDYMKYITQLDSGGLIVLGTEINEEDLEQYTQLNEPMVFLDTSFELHNSNYVELDNQASMYRNVKYAVEMGHRDIGYMRSEVGIQNFRHRYDGFKKAVIDFKIDENFHPEYFLPCDTEGSYKKMNDILRNSKEKMKMPTLFVTDLDYIAMGCMRAFKENGYRIPEDISIIGYDDVPGCMISMPKLTTTKLNNADMGQLAVERLEHILKGENDFFADIQVSSALVERESVFRIIR